MLSDIISHVKLHKITKVSQHVVSGGKSKFCKSGEGFLWEMCNSSVKSMGEGGSGQLVI